MPPPVILLIIFYTFFSRIARASARKMPCGEKSLDFFGILCYHIVTVSPGRPAHGLFPHALSDAFIFMTVPFPANIPSEIFSDFLPSRRRLFPAPRIPQDTGNINRQDRFSWTY